MCCMALKSTAMNISRNETTNKDNKVVSLVKVAGLRNMILKLYVNF